MRRIGCVASTRRPSPSLLRVFQKRGRGHRGAVVRPRAGPLALACQWCQGASRCQEQAGGVNKDVFARGACYSADEPHTLRLRYALSAPFYMRGHQIIWLVFLMNDCANQGCQKYRPGVIYDPLTGTNTVRFVKPIACSLAWWQNSGHFIPWNSCL